MKCTLTALLGLMAPVSAYAAEPVLTHFYPSAVQRGTTVSVSLSGKFDPWPCRIWTEDSGIEFKPGKEAGSFDVTVPASTRPGPHLVRAFNEEGASAPVSLLVETADQTMEKEPNDDPRTPQRIETPTAAINGRLDKSGDIDGYQLSVQKGQTLVAKVEANLLASEADMMLRITDEAGHVLVFNHDHTSMDPFIAFTAPQDGRYTVQAMGHKYPASSELQFTGGPGCPYRLQLSTGEVIRNTWPLAIQRGTRTQLTLEGWNLASRPMELESSPPYPFPVVESEVPQFLAAADPQVLVIACGVSGRLESPGDQDRFNFSSTKDAAWRFHLAGPTRGSIIDPLLRILDPDGKEIAGSDDEAGFSEAELTWKAPADGSYSAVVSDRTQQGGPEYFYHLAITQPTPSVLGFSTVHSVKVDAGKSAGIKVTVSPANGWQKKLKLAAKNLPPGVSAPEQDVPDAGGEMNVQMTAGPHAARTTQPFNLVMREVEGGTEHEVQFSMVTAGENNGVPQGYQKLLINTTSRLWLTVIPTPPLPPLVPGVAPQ